MSRRPWLAAALAAIVILSSGSVRADTDAPSLPEPLLGMETAETIAGVLTRLNAAINSLDGITDEAVARAREEAVETVVEVAAPVLSSWITASKEEAIAAGVEPVPTAMRERLDGFFAPAVLDRVRYRIGPGSGRSLQGHVFRIDRTKAITLDDVIVFRDAEAAADPLIWAHELAHVRQYERWGIDAFAARYVRRFGAVEGEAWRVHGRYRSWAQRQGWLPPTDADTLWHRD